MLPEPDTKCNYVAITGIASRQGKALQMGEESAPDQGQQAQSDHDQNEAKELRGTRCGVRGRIDQMILQFTRGQQALVFERMVTPVLLKLYATGENHQLER